MDLYRDIILDHYKNPRNFGHLVKPDAVVEEGNVTCGDKIVIEIKVKSPACAGKQKSKVKSVIGEIAFSGEGCAISQASASMLTEKVKGMNKEQILKLGAVDILHMLGTTLTPSRTKCALLSLEVLQKAVQVK